MSATPLQPGSGSVVPAESRESTSPSPSSSLPLLHFGAGGGSVLQFWTGSCSSIGGPLSRYKAIVAFFAQSTGPFRVSVMSTPSRSPFFKDAAATGSNTSHS